MSDTAKRILTLLITVVMTSILCVTMYYNDNKYHEKSPQPLEGLLVVKEDSLETDPIRHLVSGWAFYPDALLSPADFAQEDPDRYMFYTSIGEQTRFDSTGDRDDPHGSGSYFLRLILPKETATYALEVPEIYSAYKLYVGDRLVLQMGDPEPDIYTPRTQNRMITFEASGSADILIAVSDYSHFYSGMVYPPAFGTPPAVNTARGLRMGSALFADTIALLAAVLALYFGQRMKHQNAKFFSLLCVVICVYTSYSLFHSILALPVFPWYALEITSSYLLSLLLVVLHNRICNVNLLLRRISIGVTAVFCMIAFSYGILSAWLTVPVMQAFSILVSVFKTVVAAYLIITAFLSLKNSIRQVAPLFYASIIYATTFFWDRIFPAYEPVLGGWFVEWGSLALVGAIGYTLWRDITTAYQNSILFVQEHRMMVRQLAMQTEYARQLQKINDENRRLTHDFRHQLHTIEGIAAQFGENNEVLRYLSGNEPIVASLAYNRIFCSNVAVNALLQYYSTVTAEHQIKTDFQPIIPEKLQISDVALCTVLGNLLENAVEACQRQAGDKRYIKIFATLVEKTLFLVVENSSDGNYRLEDGRFLSRKPGELRFGTGLESVQHTVEQNDGTVDVFPEPTKFRVGITLSIR
ncbi:MAG: GHKL domain-containing protein [Eubacterium sp.]